LEEVGVFEATSPCPTTTRSRPLLCTQRRKWTANRKDTQRKNPLTFIACCSCFHFSFFFQWNCDKVVFNPRWSLDPLWRQTELNWKRRRKRVWWLSLLHFWPFFMKDKDIAWNQKQCKRW
jgi:hypothetical protein